jgi:RNA polymerase sigma-70 factor (ECF subfamily)
VVKNLPVDEIQRVYRFALRLARDHDAAEEIVQETFLRAWKARRGLRNPGASRVWLLKIAANVWRDRLRRAGSPAARTAPLTDHEATHLRSPERIASEEERVEQTIRAMDALPPRQRQVLFLFSIEGLSQAQIGEALEISPEAVKASLSLARRTLRRWLERLESAR